MNGLLPVAAAAAVFLLITGVGLFAAMTVQERRRRRMGKRLAAASTASESDGGQAWFRRVAEQGRRFDQLIEDPEETTVLLAQAGWRGVRARGLFYTFQLLLPVLVLGGGFPFWAWLSGRMGLLVTGVLLIFAVLLAAVAPRLVLRTAAKRRRERLRAETPLLINLLILLFEAGLNTRQALTSLVQDGARTLPEIAGELQPVLRQIEAGGDMGGLLREMASTLGVQELESVIAVLRQVERYGGEVREPLTDALETIEERRTLEIRETVNVMSGKMTVVLVACFFPALLVFIAGPAFVSIVNAVSGMGTGS